MLQSAHTCVSRRPLHSTPLCLGLGRFVLRCLGVFLAVEPSLPSAFVDEAVPGRNVTAPVPVPVPVSRLSRRQTVFVRLVCQRHSSAARPALQRHSRGPRHQVSAAISCRNIRPGRVSRELWQLQQQSHGAGCVLGTSCRHQLCLSRLRPGSSLELEDRQMHGRRSVHLGCLCDEHICTGARAASEPNSTDLQHWPCSCHSNPFCHWDRKLPQPRLWQRHQCAHYCRH
ncbi:uncharacterized protein BJ171DRAFT_598240 [Polychytrium aggregatum]|uniref:uncharacterized protein n=1 Tax=Polychytrium aggregatum TaxID=110093 RepID=UPI0022FEE2B1|nr:uncharacterized protein BJ171DRAFT_598240 [Polychytrium aggregatum]KAI9205566.1 hypothetical protein BJ171DRAFT_598240 [Polychytrium aggregatum]